tara:strand:+ start:248 stop:715 length:468 start_codon:yes stop_codon:yes gene_type:complete
MKKYLILLITILCINNTVFASFPVLTSTSTIVANDCDIIILESGEEISVNVLEITPDLIKYKKCDQEKGPLISISKEDVFMIKYHDGTKEKINHISSSTNNTDKIDTTSSKAKTFRTLSIVFSCISIIFSLFISWIIGLIFLIPALIFLGLAASS